MNFFLDLFAVLYFILVVPVPVFWLALHGWRPLWRHFGYGVYLLVCAAYLVVLSATLPRLSLFIVQRTSPEAEWFWAGLALILFGCALALRAAATLSLGTMIGIPHVVTCERSLQTKGLYAFVRHPLYLAYMLMALGFAVATGMAAMWFLFFWTVAGLGWVAMVEEKELEECFGATYVKYTRKTAMFIPKVW